MGGCVGQTSERITCFKCGAPLQPTKVQMLKFYRLTNTIVLDQNH